MEETQGNYGGITSINVIATYHKNNKAFGGTWELAPASRAQNGQRYKHERSYPRSYQAAPPPPGRLFPPRGIGSWIRATKTPETHPEERNPSLRKVSGGGIYPRTSPPPRCIKRASSPSSSPSPSHLYPLVIQ